MFYPNCGGTLNKPDVKGSESPSSLISVTDLFLDVSCKLYVRKKLNFAQIANTSPQAKGPAVTHQYFHNSTLLEMYTVFLMMLQYWALPVPYQTIHDTMKTVKMMEFPTLPTPSLMCWFCFEVAGGAPFRIVHGYTNVTPRRQQSSMCIPPTCKESYARGGERNYSEYIFTLVLVAVHAMYLCGQDRLTRLDEEAHHQIQTSVLTMQWMARVKIPCHPSAEM